MEKKCKTKYTVGSNFLGPITMKNSMQDGIEDVE